MGIIRISSVKPFESRTPYQVLLQMNYNLSFTFDDKFLGTVDVLPLVDLFNQSTNQFLSGTVYSAHLVDCDFVHDRNKAICLRAINSMYELVQAISWCMLYFFEARQT
ncbi:hypothetical protein T11_4132 [Trichinella zimbabwensis]|uniref:Uncharacterized protein n=1 Tax=Trichinella zimbabwensis TaxID=268475 RepID=A0A0V1I4J0_9BILA|nr:hypothetical protein T11_4132 [Trichinella zimbabwensis]